MGVFTRQIDRALTPVTKARKADATSSSMSAVVRQSRRQAPTTPGMYRSWSVHSPLVRANIDHLKNACRRAEWELVPFSVDLPAPDKGLMREMVELLHRPNPEDSSFGEMLERVVEDLLVLDAGVLEKERRFRGDLVAIHPTMGEFVKVDRFWDGNPRTPRYFWEPDRTISTPFLNDNMTYMRIHPRTNSGVGISYLETAKNTIDNLLSGSVYNGRMVKNAVPDGIMDLGETARPDQVDRFKAYFAAELEGKEVMGFWGGTRGAKFINFRGPGNSNRDMQYEEWLQFELRVLCAVFHTSPQDFAFGFDINKANGQVQQENTESNGALPLLEKIQDFLTAEFCQDRMWGGIRNNIAFRFRAVSQNQTLQKAETHKITLAGMPYQAINEARRDVGLPPIAPPNWTGDVMDPKNPYNQLQANTSQGLVLLSDTLTAREMAEREATPQLGSGEEKPDPKAASLLELDVVKEAITRPIQPLIIMGGGTESEPSDLGETVARETQYRTEKGQIVGKTETETREFKSPEEKVLARAKADAAKAAAALKAAEEAAILADPVRKRIVRDTRFEFDDTGRITGKTEVEREADAD